MTHAMVLTAVSEKQVNYINNRRVYTVYHKRGKICWAKLSRFSRFSGVPQKVFREYKCLSLIILNNEYLCTAFGQGNTKIFPRKLRWR